MSDETEGLYISPIPRTVSTMNGFTFCFRLDKDGTPIPEKVPPVCREEIANMGIIPVNVKEHKSSIDKMKGAKEEETEVPKRPNQTRAEQIREAIVTMAKKNDPNDFSAGGVPKVSKLNRLTRLDVTAKERDSIWMEVVASKEVA